MDKAWVPSTSEAERNREDGRVARFQPVRRLLMEERRDAEPCMFDEMALDRVDQVDRLTGCAISVGRSALGAVRVTWIADLADAVLEDLHRLVWREIIAFQERRLGIGHRAHLRGFFLQRHTAEQIADAILYRRLWIAVNGPASHLRHCCSRHGQSGGRDKHAPSNCQPLRHKILHE